jgi:hypothetical protein
VKSRANTPVDPWTDDAPAIAGGREFSAIGDGERYVLTLTDVPIEFEAERLRRFRDDLYAQVTVRCALTGARGFGGDLTVSTENLSSSTSRQRFARTLGNLARAPQIDWARLVEEFAIRMLAAESAGQPSELLTDIPDRTDDGYYDVLGIKFATKGRSSVYGKGDSGKSLFLLFVLGELAKQGVPVTLLDYEWDGFEQKKRARQLWPDGQQPPIRYRHCSRPLRDEAETIRRDILRHNTRYYGLDSIAPACHDKPEFADTAIAMARADQYIAGSQAGRLWIGHVIKKNDGTDDGNEQIFGSVFWGNLVRVSWFAKAQASDTRSDGPLICVFHHRKRNGLPQLPSVGISFQFEAGRIHIQRCDLAAQAPDLAASLPLWQRMRDTLRHGALTVADLAEQLDAKPDAIKKAAQRGSRVFIKLDGGLGIPPRIALVERRTS